GSARGARLAGPRPGLARPGWTGDQKVTYYPEHGHGVQGPRRPDPAEPPRRALPGRRPDAQRARGPLLDDALRRDEAPEAARGGGTGGHPPARPREAPLPEPRPDPTRPRPVGEQIRRALGLRADRAQAPTGGTDGEGFRDLHQDHARTPLGGDHRSRDPEQIQLRRSSHRRVEARGALRDERGRRIR